MTWIRLDDSILDHPKFVDLDHGAIVLWLAGLAHCNRFTTDGLIAAAHVPKMLRSYNVSAPAPGLLVSRGLWEPHPDGFTVHDFADYQPTKEKIETRRDQYRRSKQESRRGSVHSGHYVASTRSPGRDEEEEDPLISELTEGSSSSSPSTPRPPWTVGGQRLAQMLRETAGIEWNGAVREDIEHMLANGIAEEYIAEKIRAGARRGAKGWEYVARAIENDWRPGAAQVAAS